MFFLILSVGLLTLNASASDLARCLYTASAHGHRLEKQDSVRFCFNNFKATVSKDTCYSSLKEKVAKLSSTSLSEEIKSICFYETTPAINLEACLSETKKFKIALNHDEAVFYCYQQFQDRLSKKECLKTAGQLIYPAKKEYLQQHCLNSNN